MVQLKIVSGKMAGTEQVARHFPFRIGRSASADLRVEEDGVWDEHLELAFHSTDGFILTAHPNALAAINGQPFREAVLRNGDAIEIGALKIRFWLGATRQSRLGLREWLTWTAFALIIAAQLFLIYRMIP
ncbi:MAG TPA: FHA domain-containing protein [Verrucomicrobiae bacterium]|jgi:predicted component of type VI protein secretion system|nr:FHA domain-containing protein [Verrucomicrobiae bacterium]